MFSTEDRTAGNEPIGPTRLNAHLQACCPAGRECSVDRFMALMVRHADILKNTSVPEGARYLLGCGELMPTKRRFGKIALYTCSNRDFCGFGRDQPGINWTARQCRLFNRASVDSHTILDWLSGETI